MHWLRVHEAMQENDGIEHNMQRVAGRVVIVMGSVFIRENNKIDSEKRRFHS
jgi:hypothetical protein